MTDNLERLMAIIIGSCLIGLAFGWPVGLGVGLVSFGSMPRDRKCKYDRKKK